MKIVSLKNDLFYKLSNVTHYIFKNYLFEELQKNIFPFKILHYTYKVEIKFLL